MTEKSLARIVLNRTAAIFLVAIVSFFVFWFYIDLQYTQKAYENRLNTEVGSIQKMIRQYYLIGDFVSLRNYLDTWFQSGQLSGAFVDTNGVVIWKSNTIEPGNFSKKYDMKFENGSTVGSLEVNKDLMEPIQQKISWYLSVLGFVLMSIVLFWGLLYFVLSRALRPLEDLKTSLIMQANALGFSLHSDKENEIENIRRWFNEISTAWRIQKENAESNAKAAAFSSIASQVAHDIRSPLSALNLMMSQLQAVSEDRRTVIRSAVQRINDIANSLLLKAKSHSDLNAEVSVHQDMRVELMASLLDGLVSEKRIQYRDRFGIEILLDSSQGYGLFSLIDQSEMKRVLSNLINNSVEAIPDMGQIIVSLTEEENWNTVKVRDTGVGIPAEILKQLGVKSITYAKNDSLVSGSGLGILHAKRTIEGFGGKFQIESQPSVGTNITISLPKVAVPSWFIDKIRISQNSKILVLDDDNSILQMWKGRFQSLRVHDEGIEFVGFSSGTEFMKYVRSLQKSGNDNFQCLVDYELVGDLNNGLDYVGTLGIADKAILVTSRYEEESIRIRTQKMQLKLIPKAMVGFVPIKIV